MNGEPKLTKFQSSLNHNNPSIKNTWARLTQGGDVPLRNGVTDVNKKKVLD